MSGYDQGTTSTEPLEEDKPKDTDGAISNWDPEAPNLVDFFLGDAEENETTPGKEFLAAVAKQACDDTNQGWDDSEQHRQNHKRITSLYVGYMRTKTFPFPGCANIHMPVMLERTQRVVANTYTEIFEDPDLVYGVRPTGPEDDEVAEILTVHGNWRMRNEMPDFLSSTMEEALTEFYLFGSVIAYSYRDQVNGRNEHEVLSCDDRVVPYVFRAKSVDMHEVPWKTRILRKDKHELEDLRDSGEWSQVDEVLKASPPGFDFMTTVVRDQGDNQEGLQKPTEPNTRNSPYVFFEYHGRYRMPGETHARRQEDRHEAVHPRKSRLAGPDAL